MNIILSAKNFELTKSISQYAESKLSHLVHYDQSLKQIRAELDADKKQRVEGKFRIEVWVKGRSTAKAGAQGDTMYSAIDNVLPKLIRQLEKKKLMKISKVRRKLQ
jgi:ribosomal subunit interface protein